jgi:hypothetical protein
MPRRSTARRGTLPWPPSRSQIPSGIPSRTGAQPHKAQFTLTDPADMRANVTRLKGTTTRGDRDPGIGAKTVPLRGWRLVGVAAFILPAALHAQTFELNPEANSIERGKPFLITLEIATDTPLSDFAAELRLPSGFSVIDGPQSIAVPSLARGRHAFDFQVQRPLFTRIGGIRPGDSLNFRADVSYRAAGEARSDFVMVRVFYTTSMFVYFVSGVLGVLLGFGGKALLEASSRGEPKATLRSPDLALRAGTTLFLGLLVLVFLARTGLPVHNWIAALALGVVLGFAGDDTLVSKLAPAK